MYDFNCDDYVCPLSILSAVSSQRVEQHQKQTSDLFGDRIVKVDQIEEVKSAVCIGRKCAVWRFDAAAPIKKERKWVIADKPKAKDAEAAGKVPRGCEGFTFTRRGGAGGWLGPEVSQPSRSGYCGLGGRPLFD